MPGIGKISLEIHREMQKHGIQVLTFEEISRKFIQLQATKKDILQGYISSTVHIERMMTNTKTSRQDDPTFPEKNTSAKQKVPDPGPDDAFGLLTFRSCFFPLSPLSWMWGNQERSEHS